MLSSLVPVATAVAVTVLCAWSPLARATAPIPVTAEKQALVLNEKAVLACDSGRTDEGALLLKRAFELDRDHFYVWALGLCLLTGQPTAARLDEAETTFITYRTLTDASPEWLAQVPAQLAKIKELRAGLEAQESGLTAPAIAGITSLGLGAASGLISLGLHLSAADLRDQVRDTLPADPSQPVTGHTERSARDKQDEANRQDLGAVIMASVGGAALVAGAVLLVVGLASEDPEPAASVGVAPWVDLRGASLVARF